MRRLLVVLIALTVVSTACGDNASPLSATTTTRAATTTTAGEANEYPQEIVDAYMEGCTGEDSYGFCLCTIEEIQERMDLAEFLEWSETFSDSDPVAIDIITTCGGTPPGPDPDPDPDPGPLTIDQLISLSIVDLEEFWSAEMPAVWGIDYQPVAAFGPYYVSRGDVPECGGPLGPESYSQNAFYCSVDDTVQWDIEDLILPLYEEYGDFTVALVMAHEWGHAIQARFGFSDEHPTIVQELQADCLAGAWTYYVDSGQSQNLILEPGDLEEAMAGFLLIGDGLGTAPDGPNAHGGSFDRLTAFFDGFNNGVAACDTYQETYPPVVFIELDPAYSGNLPYETAATVLIDALEGFWAIVFPDAFGMEWIPMSGAYEYYPSSGDVPSCGGFFEDPEFYPGNAFYCEDEDFAAWDGEGLFPYLYDEIGDFAMALVLADLWGRAVLARLEYPVFGPEAQLQVDCMAGAWTAALTFEDNPMQLWLSAGDLEEGIAGFLLLSAVPGSEGAVSAFQRFEAFKGGVFDGISACGL